MTVCAVVTAFKYKEIENIHPMLADILNYPVITNIILCVGNIKDKDYDNIITYYKFQKRVDVLRVDFKGPQTINEDIFMLKNNYNCTVTIVLNTLSSLHSRWYSSLTSDFMKCKSSEHHKLISSACIDVQSFKVYRPNLENNFIDIAELKLKKPYHYFLGFTDFLACSSHTFDYMLRNYQYIMYHIYKNDIFSFSYNLYRIKVSIFLPHEKIVGGSKRNIYKLTKQKISPVDNVSKFFEICKLDNNELPEPGYDSEDDDDYPEEEIIGKVQHIDTGKSKIFVSIAAFMDSNLNNTIDDMIAKAEYPERLVIGVVHQNTVEAMKSFRRRYIRDKDIKIIDIFHGDTKGCCYARSEVQSLMTDEPLYMQIDAHHKFVDKWDTLCETMLEQCYKYTKKPILSTYATICDMSNGGFKITHQDVPFRMKCEKFYDFPKVRYVPEIVPNWKNLSEPQPWFTVSGHFIFTSSKWVKEVPYDPELYFDGEEDTLSLRSWTNGWDIFYPHKVVLYHYYIRSSEPKHFNVDKEWYIKNNKSKLRLNNILGITKSPIPIDPKFLLGDVRSYEDYVDKYKVDYHKKLIKGQPSLMTAKEFDFQTQEDEIHEPVVIVKRLTFTHERGRFVKLDDVLWEEQTNNGLKYRFKQTAYDNGIFVLEDKTRNCVMRIEDKNDSTCEVQFGDQPMFVLYRYMSKNGNTDTEIEPDRMEPQPNPEKPKIIEPEIIEDRSKYDIYINLPNGDVIKRTDIESSWIYTKDNKDTECMHIEDTLQHYIIKDTQIGCEYKIFKKLLKIDAKMNNGIHTVANNIKINKRPAKPRVINPGKNIAIVMVFTPNVYNYALIAEKNIIAYAKENEYTCYIYRDIVSNNLKEHPTWNKPIVLQNHIKEHEYVMWMDADAIFTNFDTRIEDIIEQQPTKDLLLCSDIGGWKFNAGVQIWKNTDWSISILRTWLACEHIDHMKGGDQAQLIEITNGESEDRYHIFDETVFNTHPKKHQSGMYILHMMGMSPDVRVKTFEQWNTILIVPQVKIDDYYIDIKKNLTEKKVNSVYHLDCGDASSYPDFMEVLDTIEYKGFDKDNTITVGNNSAFENYVFKQEFDINSINFDCDAVMWISTRNQNIDRFKQFVNRIKESPSVRYLYAHVNLQKLSANIPKPTDVIGDFIGVWDAFFLRVLIL